MSPQRKRALVWLLGTVLVVALLGAAAGVWWGTHPLGPTQSALAALVSDSSVQVTHAADGWEFAPPSGEPSSALVFYPGGHLDARSYAPYARAVAARGYLVVIPVMPLSLAVLAPDSASAVISAHPKVARWTIGGHSLGGVMAASYAAKHANSIRGLILLAAYPPSGAELRLMGIVALTQVGTLDTVINRANLAAGLKQLPESAAYEQLQGGNHAQFGDYGLQPGDNPHPTMPAAEQLRRAASGTAKVLADVAAR
ncbi:MAG: alpha/beta fold hydrolase [Coriobacteriia bacterium]|nr:alpha/beta fold hydrolase [Coriobacteriia bacterium]